MSIGLIALLDDVAALAKLAASSVDDAIAQSAKAGSKAAGIVIDDAAVTPRYVIGFAAKRELPIIARIAVGSLKNKIVFLLPGALLLSVIAPWVVTPLLMLGGAYLCYEGWHKVSDLFSSHSGNQSASEHSDEHLDGAGSSQLEEERIQSAIRTDFILSAEIMAIGLSTVSESTLWVQGTVLAVIGVGMTVLVYGVVAIIVKADDFGAYLALRKGNTLQLIGRGIVIGMPVFLKLLGWVGTVAMLWVGGGILLHGLHVLGVHGPEDSVNALGDSALGALGGGGAWAVKAGVAAVIGLVVGALVSALYSGAKKFVPAQS